MAEEESIIQAQLAVDHGERLVHALFLMLAIVVMVASFVLRSDGLSGVYFPGGELSFPRTCTSRIIFGIDCPGCGMTRAFIAICDGRFADAWQLNRASFVMFAFVLVQIPWHSVQLARLRLGRPTLYWPGVYAVPVTVVLLMLINWLFKISGV